MKKLFIITMTLAAFTLQAQDVTFGAKAGLNFSNLSYDYPSGVNAPDLDSRTSIHLGVTAEISISDNFSVITSKRESSDSFTIYTPLFELIFRMLSFKN